MVKRRNPPLVIPARTSKPSIITQTYSFPPTGNPLLRGEARAELSRQIWRRRKREGGKGKCAFCQRPIYAGGVVYVDKPYHKTCLESKKFGLTRKQAGMNPVRPFEWWGYFITPTGRKIPYTVKALTRNEALEKAHKKIRFKVEEIAGPWESSVRGRRVFNPNRRARDSYAFYGARELNPRPPAAWWSKMWTKAAAGYPRKVGESLAKWRADINRITAGIWYGYPESTRVRLIKKYERLAVPARAL